MLSDLFASFRTPISPHLRAMGYLDEALDMRGRARLNSAAWQPHLDSTRSFVLSSAERCRRKETAVILGSGLLLDVPLAELSAMFRKIVLRDVVCLPEIRRRINRYANVRFIEHDVTGIAKQLYRNSRSGTPHLPEIPPAAGSVGADLLVSLNILSQLWVVPRVFIGRHMSDIPADQTDEWCGKLVKSHSSWLRSLPCDVCLVADVEQVKRDSTGSIISRSSTVCDHKLPHPDAAWTWNIAPICGKNPHSSKELTVGAWRFCSETEDMT